MSNNLSGKNHNSRQRETARRDILAVGAVAMVVGVMLSASAERAHATPAGLANYPSTDIYTKNNFHFDADTFASTSGDSVGSSLGLSYGLGPEKDGVFGRSDIGFDYVTSTGGGINFGKRLLVNGKTQLYNDSAAQTRVVAGFYGVGSRDIGAGNWIYLLGAKGFEFGRVHVGVAHALRDNVAGSRTVLQLGYDKSLSKDLLFAVDFQSGKGQFIAPSMIYNLNDKAGLQLAYLRGGSETGPRNQLYLGFDYNFGKVGAPATDAGGATEGVGGAGGGGG